jgi:hypothetical protein
MRVAADEIADEIALAIICQQYLNDRQRHRETVDRRIRYVCERRIAKGMRLRELDLADKTPRCAECRQTKRLYARGMCEPCYRREVRAQRKHRTGQDESGDTTPDVA